MTSRRGFLLGLGTALAAPSIVRAESLMKLWVPPAVDLIPYAGPSQTILDALTSIEGIKTEIFRKFAEAQMMYGSVGGWTHTFYDASRQTVVTEIIAPERVMVSA